MDEETGVINPNRSQHITYLHSTSYDLFILVLTIFALLVAAGLLLPLSSSAETILLSADFGICILLLFDFLLSFWRAPRRAEYFLKRGGWLDLLGSIPVVPGLTWTAIFRLARLNRMIGIIRRLRGEERVAVITDARENPARSALLTTIGLAILLATIASLLILRFERGAAGANITTGATAFWWAIVTMTTVGYGDFVPVTPSGRILAVALMGFGVGILAVLTSFLASNFMIVRHDQDDIITLMREENAVIRAELADLKALIAQRQETNE